MKKTLFLSMMLVAVLALSACSRQNTAPVTPAPQQNEPVGGGNQLILEGEADTSAIDTDISTWKSYTNDSCDFSIKFPSSYVVLSDMATCADGTDYNAQTYNVIHIANQEGCLITELGQQPAKGCEIHSVYLLNSEPSASGPNITNSTELVDDVQSNRITIIESQVGQITVATPYNNVWYNYLYSFASANLDTAEKTLEKILSTVEFK